MNPFDHSLRGNVRVSKFAMDAHVKVNSSRFLSALEPYSHNLATIPFPKQSYDHPAVA